MTPGGPDVKAIFTGALELPAGPDRDTYLAGACGGDDALRRRVEELLAAFDRASDVLGPAGPPATAVEAGALTVTDAATEAFEPDRRAGPEATAAKGQAIDEDRTDGHAQNAARRDPETAASHGDRSNVGGDDGALPPGAAVRYFGDYEIRREVGRGGMGIVYEARQVSLNRPVALKMVRAGLLAGDDELRRFQNEAEAVALLDHPGVVPVYEVGEHHGQRYFSMKLVPGGSLVPLMDRYKDDPRAAARLVAEAAEAVAHAHARGILHRDLKPANILIDAQGHPHVTDFGLAKKVEADVELTQSGAILGTPAYMSPEQASGRRGVVTTASDVYGLGAVLYVLLTGRAPFGGDSVVETIDAVRNASPEPPRRLNAAIPRDLETICLKCLEKSPGRRYSTAHALADDLKAWLDSRAIAARRVGVAERAWLWCRRKPAVAALSAAVLLAVVVGTAAVIAVQREANRVLNAKNADLTNSLRREAKANADLAAANARVEQRYDLAVDAIKTFHTGVSEDFLLKQDQFRSLRDRLLKSASDFYGKLGALLGQETDLASRRALARSNFELAELTSKVGRNEDALAAHRAVLAAREALAAEPGADAGMTAEVGRSLTAVAGLLEATGKTDEALASCRRSESLLADPAGADPSARAALAACRSLMGWLLTTTGKFADALAAYRLARADQEALAAAPEAPNDARLELAGTVHRIATLLSETGKPVEAEAEFRTALAIYQQLADDNPAVTQFRSDLANIHINIGWLLTDWMTTGKPAEAEAEFRTALAVRQKLADDNPPVTRFRSDLALVHRNLGYVLSRTGKPSEAEAEYRKALALYQTLTDDNPAVAEFRSGLTLCLKHFAALQAWFGQDAEWRTTCRRALEYARNGDHYTLEQVSSACCLRPSADPEQLKAALDLASRAVQLYKREWGYDWRQMALGMAEYRNGRYAEADKTLAAAAETGARNPPVRITSAFYRAMSLFKQGQAEEARRLALGAAAQMKPLPQDDKDLAGGADHDDLILWLAYKEARALLNLQAAPTASTPTENRK